MDFPRLTRMLALDVNAPDLPPLKKSVTVAKMYLYKKDRAESDCGIGGEQEGRSHLHGLQQGRSQSRLVVGRKHHRIGHRPHAVPCALHSRPRDQRQGLETPAVQARALADGIGIGGRGNVPEGSAAGAQVQQHAPCVSAGHGSHGRFAGSQSPAGGGEINPAQTNILLFAKPDKRLRNLLDFVGKTPIDLIVMAPNTRAKFSNRLMNDVLVKLLRATDSPVLLLR